MGLDQICQDLETSSKIRFRFGRIAVALQDDTEVLISKRQIMLPLAVGQVSPSELLSNP